MSAINRILQLYHHAQCSTIQSSVCINTLKQKEPAVKIQSQAALPVLRRFIATSYAVLPVLTQVQEALKASAVRDSDPFRDSSYNSYQAQLMANIQELTEQFSI